MEVVDGSYEREVDNIMDKQSSPILLQEVRLQLEREDAIFYRFVITIITRTRWVGHESAEKEN